MVLWEKEMKKERQCITLKRAMHVHQLEDPPPLLPMLDGFLIYYGGRSKLKI